MQIINLYLSYFNQSGQVGQIHVKLALRVYCHNFSYVLAHNGKAKILIFSGFDEQILMTIHILLKVKGFDLILALMKKLDN